MEPKQTKTKEGYTVSQYEEDFDDALLEEHCADCPAAVNPLAKCICEEDVESEAGEGEK